MAAIITLFQFRLSDNRSVSRSRLEQIWSVASNSPKAAVSRSPRPVGRGHTYSLLGPSDLYDLPSVEARLRVLLNKQVEGAGVTLLRMA